MPCSVWCYALTAHLPPLPPPPTFLGSGAAPTCRACHLLWMADRADMPHAGRTTSLISLPSPALVRRCRACLLPFGTVLWRPPPTCILFLLTGRFTSPAAWTFNRHSLPIPHDRYRQLSPANITWRTGSARILPSHALTRNAAGHALFSHLLPLPRPSTPCAAVPTPPTSSPIKPPAYPQR